MNTEDSPSVSRDEQAAALLAIVCDPATSVTARSRAREDLVTQHLPLVRYCAVRFTGRGETVEDLVQVGALGLLKSIDRFDVSKGPAFASFAMPTIIGEIRRHLRDRSQLVRLPRGLQEFTVELSITTAELTATLGRSPSPYELASHLSVTPEEVLAGLEALHARRVASLDAPDPHDGRAPIGERIAAEGNDLELVEQIETLRPLLYKLPERERRILELRFGRELSQAEIATELGISQMHVSRLLTKTLAVLRQAALTDD